MNTTIRLAGNLIEFASDFAGVNIGHLQLVRVNGNVQEEIEVTNPDDLGAYGEWQYNQVRDHTNPANTPISMTNINDEWVPSSSDYAKVDLIFGGVMQMLSGTYWRVSMQNFSVRVLK